ncbi:MAG: aspartyl protease family protein [Bacteroidota bacterium]
MRKLWLIWLFVLSGWTVLPGQRNVALLDAPVRSLQHVHLDHDEQEAYPFILDQGLIYIEAKLDGTSGAFILDTGAPGLVINETPTQLHEDYRAQSCSQEVVVGMRPVAQFIWGEKEWGKMEAITLDLQHLQSSKVQEVRGLLGYELLQEYTLILNYQQEQLRLLDQPVNVALHQPSVRLPFVLDGHLPVVEVKIGGQLLRLGIDTGSASNILNKSWQNLVEQNSGDSWYEELQGLDQTVQLVDALQVEELQFGDEFIGTKFLMLDLSHLQDPSSKPLDGLLGHDFLTHFKVAIDYPRGEILLWPAAL